MQNLTAEEKRILKILDAECEKAKKELEQQRKKTARVRARIKAL